MLAGVKRVGICALDLRHAAEGLRGDPEVVLAAVQRSGEALRYASQHLREDKTFVLSAVTCKGSALAWAWGASQIWRDASPHVSKNALCLFNCQELHVSLKRALDSPNVLSATGAGWGRPARAA